MKLWRGRIITVVFVLAATVPLAAAGGAEPSPASGAASGAAGTGEAANTSPSSDSAALEAEMQAVLADLGLPVFDRVVHAVDFGIEDLAGSSRSLGELEGSFVFLNFWATWCPPCREEMPSMEAMYAELGGRNFEILAISVQESPGIVRDYVESGGYSFPVLLDGAGQVASRYGVRGLPTTFFVAPTGRVLGMLMGIRHWDEPRELAAMRRLAELSAQMGPGGDE